MATQLLTGAAGSGKTTAAIEQVIAQIDRDPFSTIWVVLPSDLHGDVFRGALFRTLTDRSGSAAYFGVRFFDFYDLYSYLLQITGDPQRRIDAAAQARILRIAIARTTAELTHFNQIVQLPGFVALVAGFIRELKQSRITPAQFSAAACDAKDQDLALIYTQYQELLQNQDLVDIEGEGWLALAHVSRQEKLSQPVSLLVIDGYDQFNRVQAELIGLLSQRVARTAITLTYQAERTESAHRRFAQTYDRLRQFVQWTEKQIDPTAADRTRSAELNHLSANLFEPAVSAVMEATAIRYVELADPRREVEHALRLIKRELLAETVPDDIALVANDFATYAPHIVECAARYGLPISIRDNTAIAENPAVATLIALIDLKAADFPRRAVIDLLRSPYVTIPGLDSAAIDALDRISREQIVVSSREQWLAALAQPLAHAAGEDDDDEPGEAAPSVDQAALKASLVAFFDGVTPLTQARVYTYMCWIEALIGPDTELDPGLVNTDGQAETLEAAAESYQEAVSVQLLRNSRAWTDPATVTRDLLALAALKSQLIDLLAAYALFDAETVVDWPTFRADLQNILDTAVVKPAGGRGREGRILVGSVFNVRGLPHQLVYVLGLGEGQFPARVPEDALYLDAERAAINQSLRPHSVQLLTRAERADEASLFYELTAMARQRLILSRSYSDNGNPWPPSAFWVAARAVFESPVDHIALDVPAAIDWAASAADVMVAIMAVQQNTLSGADTDKLLGAVQWLQQHSELSSLWARVRANQQIEQERSAGGQSSYRGYMAHKTVREAVAEQLGAHRLWSAAQFNEYARCPFGFFAKRLLNVQPLSEPEAGADERQIGSLVHAILEATYQWIGEERLLISPENQARALEILGAVTHSKCLTAPADYGFRRDNLWEQRQNWLGGQLRDLVKLDFSDDSPINDILPGARRPFRQEAGFDSFVISGAAGPLAVRGRIDRVDVSDDKVVVIDYKSGATPIGPAEMVAGRNVQMLLYTAAIGQQIQPVPLSVSGTFWHIANRKLSGKINTVADAVILDQAMTGLHQRVIDARQGMFPASTDQSGKCTPFCELSQLCRVRANAGQPDD